MGDHRASIKIEMSFHGVKDNCDMWINYYPHDCCGMDERIIQFFKRVYDRGMEKYEAEASAYWAKENAKQIEDAERQELLRLKQKYEDKGGGG